MQLRSCSVSRQSGVVAGCGDGLVDGANGLLGRRWVVEDSFVAGLDRPVDGVRRELSQYALGGVPAAGALAVRRSGQHREGPVAERGECLSLAEHLRDDGDLVALV